LAHASKRTQRKLLAPHWRTELSVTAAFWSALVISFITLYGGSLLVRTIYLHLPLKVFAWLTMAFIAIGAYVSLALWAGFLLSLCKRLGFRVSDTPGLGRQILFALILIVILRPYMRGLFDVVLERPLGPQFSVEIKDERTLDFKGIIGTGATRALEAALLEHPDVTTVQLESPGGLVLESYLMARTLREHDLQTRVDGSCASACTFAYLGGSTRSLGTGGRLRFHRARLSIEADGTESSIVNIFLSRYMKQRGVSKDFVKRVFSTPASTLWQPTMSELLDSGVVNEIRASTAPVPRADDPLPAGVRKELAPYASLVQHSKLPQIVLVPEKGPTSGVTSSHLRGQPYWPRNLPYPMDAAGAPMVMLVQLNFAEMPPLPGYPTTGLLQFFLSSSADDKQYLGMSSAAVDSGDPRMQFAALQKPEYFRVIYHPHIEDSKNLLPPSQIPAPGPGELPLYDTAGLAFERRDSYVGPTDYRFERLFGATDEILEKTLGNDFEPIERHWQSFEASRLATVGGYSRTEQGFDPRSAVMDEDWVVLLSIDSSADSDLNVSWGDGGVANWWIERSALERLDFSHVAYYYDSG
jgi:uncharacterized protein YwqG